jgi:nicotinamidase/pyrazinamidase
MKDTAAALLVLDMQRDFLQPEGRMALEKGTANRLIAVVNSCINAAQDHGCEVFYVCNEFDRTDWKNILRNGAAIAGTPGAALDPRIFVYGDERVSKRTGDAFKEGSLHDSLTRRGVRNVFIVGVYAEACVHETALGALRRGYRVSVVSDGVGTSTPRRLARALEQARRAGIDVIASAELPSLLKNDRESLETSTM